MQFRAHPLLAPVGERPTSRDPVRSSPRRDRLDTLEVLSHALQRRGLRLSAAALDRALGSDISLPRLAQLATESGLQARLSSVAAAELGYVPDGAVVNIGKLVGIVVGRTRRELLIERSLGRREQLPLHTRTSGVALVLAPPGHSPSDVRTLVRHWLTRERGARRSLWTSIAAGLLISSLGLLVPVLSRLAANEALPANARGQVHVIAIASVAIGLHSMWAHRIRHQALAYLEIKLAELISSELFAHLLRVPFGLLMLLRPAAVTQAHECALLFARSLPLRLAAFVEAAIGCGSLVILAVLDLSLAGVMLLIGCAAVALGWLHARGSAGVNAAIIAAAQRQGQCLVDNLMAIDTVKAQGGEVALVCRWLELLMAEQQTRIARQDKETWFTAALGALERSAFAAALGLVGYRALAGERSLGDVIAAVQASTSFMLSVHLLARLPAEWLALAAQSGAVDAILELPAEEQALAVEGVDDSLELRDVWFRYDASSPWIVRGASFKVSPGEHVMIRWPSGAGKTTLLRLLAGLLPPTRGEVLAARVDAARARHRIHYLPQSVSLIPGSVLENLRALSGEASPERIAAAARETQLADVVRQWPMGFETLVGLGAASISTGQKQLILLTAAVASTRPILLLDEALAHLDGQARQRLAAANLFRGRTVVSVTHDSPCDGHEVGRVISPGAAAR